jgi:acetyl-CoA C-acetyltransferase
MSANGRVAIVGTGKTHFGENFDRSFGEMAAEAAYAAYDDAGIGPDDVQAAWLGAAFAYTYSEEGNAGTSLAEPLGLFNRPVSRVANYCATGMDALRHATAAVEAGEHDCVLVVGCEKMRDVGPRQSLLAQHIERGHPIYAKGRTAPGMFGLIATRYEHTYGSPRDAMTQVAVKNHGNGALNEYAHFRQRLTPQQVATSAPVSGMLRLFDCCPTTDGAAALVVTTEDRAKALRPDDYVVVQAIELAATTGYFSAQFDSGNEFLGFTATRQAAKQAYERAGITDPSTEIHVAEVHDCFTITEVVNYEDLGFAEPGKGTAFVLEGASAIDGRLPVNTSGGLQSCGHPIGATGARVVADIADQIRGRAGARQVRRADVGLAHTLGGPGSVASVGVLSSKDWRPARAA